MQSAPTGMPELVFVDTNVFAYALDTADPDKRIRAIELINDHRNAIVVSTQVLLELHAVCTRKLGLARDAATRTIDAVAQFPVVTTDRNLVLDAANLAARAQLSIFDAAIIRAASRAACSLLISEDLADGQRFDALEIRNPFR
jgi:predicted nucleic acid-binding protein